MKPRSQEDIALAIQRLTGVTIDLRDEAIKGRNVWGRVAFMQSGMVHVEIMPGDKIVNDAVMPSITADDMQLGREQRRGIYRERCRKTAGLMNAQAIDENKLFLLISSNGYLSKRARNVIEVLL